MSKVTIKFWDKERQQYSDRCGHYIDEDMNVFFFEDTSYENYMRELHAIETHFYKDGKRIA